MPFLADHLWRTLVAPCPDAPSSVHLAGWPQPPAADRDLLADIDEVRVVASLGHQARQSASLKVRQPLRRIVVEGATRVGRTSPT